MFTTRLLVLAVLSAAAAALFAVPAQGATTTQYGTKCRAAWTGSRTTQAYRTYRTRCIKAARAATSIATDAGNPASRTANRSRAIVQCTTQFPPPRTTAIKRRQYNACVKAVSNAQKAYATRPLKSSLKGSLVIPKAGSATGRLSLRLNEAKRRVCFDLTASGLGIGQVSGASINRGKAGKNGSAVVTLGNGLTLDALNHKDRASGCVQHVRLATIRAILRTPKNYYVLLKTQSRVKGAARGQLRK